MPKQSRIVWPFLIFNVEMFLCLQVLIICGVFLVMTSSLFASVILRIVVIIKLNRWYNIVHYDAKDIRYMMFLFGPEFCVYLASFHHHTLTHNVIHLSSKLLLSQTLFCHITTLFLYLVAYETIWVGCTACWYHFLSKIYRQATSSSLSVIPYFLFLFYSMDDLKLILISHRIHFCYMLKYNGDRSRMQF